MKPMKLLCDARPLSARNSRVKAINDTINKHGRDSNGNRYTKSNAPESVLDHEKCKIPTVLPKPAIPNECGTWNATTRVNGKRG